MRPQLPLLLLIAATLPLASSTVARPVSLRADSAEGTQVIAATAKKYEFDPSPIRVKQGAKVQLKITATDHAHGFKISELADGAAVGSKPGLAFSSPQDCTKIEEGKTAVVEFVAQTPGTYSFRCCVHCGWHHRAMKGELIVEP
jgi:heme/copper-type cytochrome/quinol oxidase subunit 2